MQARGLSTQRQSSTSRFCEGSETKIFFSFVAVVRKNGQWVMLRQLDGFNFLAVSCDFDSSLFANNQPSLDVRTTRIAKGFLS